jgi:hypothetical protein
VSDALGKYSSHRSPGDDYDPNPKKVHELKCWPEPFEATIAGEKTFEIRKMDRPFKKDDTLWLREWDPQTVRYSGRECRVTVTFIAMPGEWNLPLDTCVMSIKPIGGFDEILTLIGL